jgi:hypothetical protein
MFPSSIFMFLHLFILLFVVAHSAENNLTITTKTNENDTPRTKKRNNNRGKQALSSSHYSNVPVSARFSSNQSIIRSNNHYSSLEQSFEPFKEIPSKSISHPSIALESIVSISPNLFMQLVAGGSSIGFSGDNGPATSAQINAVIPWVDNSGNIYIPDNTNYRIRKVNTAGIITTFGGTGTSSFTGTSGPIGSVSFHQPWSIVGDAGGTVLYFSDMWYVWEYVFNTNIVTVVAGSKTLGSGFSGDNGDATSAQLYEPRGLWLTTSGDLYIADYNNNRIREVFSSGIITTVAGFGASGGPGSFSGDNGLATSAALSRPVGVYVDTSGKLFIADYGNYRIRVVDTNNIITTFAGSGSATPFNGNNIPAASANFYAFDVKGDSLGNFYIADSSNQVIIIVDTSGIIATLFGIPNSGGFPTGISSRSSSFNSPCGIWIDSQSTIYFSDSNSIRRSIIVSSPTSQPSGQPNNHPSGQPSRHPSSQPTKQPTSRPSTQPSQQPTNHPTSPSSRPSRQPTTQPTSRPTRQPSSSPSIQPASLPTSLPTSQPSRQPSSRPTTQPTMKPSRQPTCQPTEMPSQQPSMQPTSKPSSQPTGNPSQQPSSQPSTIPSKQPIAQPTRRPSTQPTSNPTRQPSSFPTSQPSDQPTSHPTRQPISHPSRIPTTQPTVRPTTHPSGQPSSNPSRRPSSNPTSQPTLRPTTQPSDQPTSRPTRQPTSQPSLQPTIQPSCHPTGQPSSLPSLQPTQQPSNRPSCQPSSQPSSRPSSHPSRQPTSQPTLQPSSQPSRRPSTQPTVQPTDQPTNRPSVQPTQQPTRQPSEQPTDHPTVQPFSQPSSRPSEQPTEQPTTQPTPQPSGQPTSHPSMQPTQQPTRQPSEQPTGQPTVQPFSQPSSRTSEQPTKQPTTQPTPQPSDRPSSQPTTQPSTQPSTVPSIQPSVPPTNQPTSQPSSLPSIKPSNQPSNYPSSQPTSLPTNQPSESPTDQPTSFPSSQPANVPSSFPSVQPSDQPTACPSCFPTSQPSGFPSSQPTMIPSSQPTNNPRDQPSSFPSGIPSNIPTARPTVLPTESPTNKPSSRPSDQPTFTPTIYPTTFPTNQPSCIPSLQPTTIPTVFPSNQPSDLPTSFPTEQPSSFPSDQPIVNPSLQPSSLPTSSPTLQPFSSPTTFPSCQPIAGPTSFPSNQPTTLPSKQPNSFPTSCPTRQPSTIPTIQPFSHPTSTPMANIYQTKGVLFYPGNAIYSGDSLTDSDEILGSSFILFGKNYRYEGAFPFVLSLQSEKSKLFVSLVNDSVSGIASDTMTRSTTILGDINNDGFLDLMIGFPLDSKCLVYLGTSFGVENTESFKIIGDPENGGGQLGSASTRVGDLNHDGFDEIVVSAPFDNIVYLIYGRSEFSEDISINNLTPKDGFKIIGSEQDTDFGVALALVHDFNKDGNQDIAITAVRPEGENAIYILLGNALFGKEDIQIDQLNENRFSYFRIISSYLSYAGYSIAGIGDINNDGYNDLAIGSIPINNARYAEQRTYIIYGRDITAQNDFYLNEMTKKDGFIVTGGGFLVQATDDVDGDGITDVMITSYYDWKGRGNTYLINYPKNVTQSPTFQPSSSPTNFPSSIPSFSPFSSPPSISPSLSQASFFFPTFLNSSVPLMPSTDFTNSPTITATHKPSPVPTFRPSFRPSIRSSHSFIPSPPPTILSTRKPSPSPTFIRHISSPQPVFTVQPTRNYGFLRKSKSPSSFPTMMPTINITNDYTTILCNKPGEYTGRNETNYMFIINANTGIVNINGNADGGAKNLYVLYCPKDRVNVEITNFRLSTDIISIVHLVPYSYSSTIDISHSSQSGPLTLLFCSENKLQMILSSHISFDLQEGNFLFTQLNSFNVETQNKKETILSQVEIGLVFLVLVFLLAIVFALSYQSEIDKKEKEKHEEDLLNSLKDPGNASHILDPERQQLPQLEGGSITCVPTEVILFNNEPVTQNNANISNHGNNLPPNGSSSSTSTSSSSESDNNEEIEEDGDDDIQSVNTDEWQDALAFSDDEDEEEDQNLHPLSHDLNNNLPTNQNSISPNSEIFESNQFSSSSSSSYSSNEESFQNIIIFPVGSENQEDQQDNENNDDTSSINTDEWQDALEPSDDEGSI